MPRRLLFAAGVAACLGLAYWLGAFEPAMLRGHFAGWKAATDARPVRAAAVFAAAYVAVTSLSLPVGVWLSLLGGALFGRAVGIPLVLASATIGATAAMLSARYVLRDWVRRTLGGRLAGLDRGGVYYLVSLRLVLVAPFWAVNLAAGVTNMSVSAFMLGTFVGMLPATALFVNAGYELGDLASPTGVVTWRIGLAFALVAALPLVAKRLVRPSAGHRHAVDHPPAVGQGVQEQ